MINTDELDEILLSKKKRKKRRKGADVGIENDKEKKVRKKKRARELDGDVDYYVHAETSNPSFIKMYRILQSLGVENNKFHLALYDTELIHVNPYDENLTLEEKTRIIVECKNNFWYFIRECIRVPVSGSGIAPGLGKKYGLHRGNLALSYCIVNNLNSYTELPRQSGKSISVDIALLWLLNYGTNTSKMIIMNKDHDGAKENILRIQEMRDCLPEFLHGNMKFNAERKKLKSNDNKEYIECLTTNNRVDTKASPRNPGDADNAGRGCTTPIQWFDEFAFLKYNDIIFKAAA